MPLRLRRSLPITPAARLWLSRGGASLGLGRGPLRTNYAPGRGWRLSLPLAPGVSYYTKRRRGLLWAILAAFLFFLFG